MVGVRLLFLIALFDLPELISGENGNPFRSEAFHFNNSKSVGLNSEVCLLCEYLLFASPSEAFTMIISFVPKDKLTPAQLAEASSRAFIFPEVLKAAHKNNGKVLNKTYYKPPGNESKSVYISVKFNMASNRVGSYICQVYQTNTSLISTKDWTLTKWIYLEGHPSSIYPTLVQVTIPICAVYAVLLVGVCYLALRLRRIIFKRVLIENSPYINTSYVPPKITIVDEKKPPFMVYVRNIYQRKWFRTSSSLDKTISKNDVLLGSSLTQMSDQSNVCVHFVIPSDKSFDLPLNRLRVERLLGQGAFGLVYFGSAVNLPGDIKGPIPVAIKTLRGTPSEADLVAFLHEIEMMKFIGKHENVIQLYATTSYKGRPVMVMEYGERGSLKDYLQKCRQSLSEHPTSLDITQLQKIAFQVAKGMAYLASKGVVHRDLAARNVVLSQDLVAKVADFGLTRKAEFYYRMQKSGRVPLKWLAPESVCQKVFTSKSDVWSFGVLLWELFSLGETPASNVPNDAFLEALSNGVTLYTKPKLAEDKLYKELMQRCWNRLPKYRPNFDEIVDILLALYPAL